MSLSEMNVFNVIPKVKPVVRIGADNKAVVVSSHCRMGLSIANRYVDYHSFFNSMSGMVLVTIPDRFKDPCFYEAIDGTIKERAIKKPTD